MAMVIVTIEKAGLVSMGAILGEPGRFVNGIIDNPSIRLPVWGA